MVLAPLLIVMGGIGDSPQGFRARQARDAFESGLESRADPVQAKVYFREAFQWYKEIHDHGTHNAALYRSQGNAALLAGDLPNAILAYRRGLRHDPADAGLQLALRTAREEVLLKVKGSFGRPPSSDRPPWLPLVGFSTWSFLWCLLAWSIGWFSLARWRMVNERGPLYIGIVALLLASGTAVFLGLATLYEQKANERVLVVIAQEELPLRLGNGTSYSSRYQEKLPRGVEASLVHQRGDWLQIELSGGEIGWVPLTGVLLDKED